MSRTYRDIRKYKTKRFWQDWFGTKQLGSTVEYVAKNRRLYNHIGQLYTDYNSAPSWFVRMFMTRPSRRTTKLLLQMIKTDVENGEGLIFPTARKPFVYYY